MSLTATRSTLSVARLTSLARRSGENLASAPFDDRVNGGVHQRFFKNHVITPLPDVPQHMQLFPRGARFVYLPSDGETRFNMNAVFVDLTPRPVMSAGPLIDLLVRTNAGHYVGFHALDALYQQMADVGLQRVPASRSDVFQHTYVTAIEKRRLTRFVKWCINPLLEAPEAYSPALDASFISVLSDMQLSDKLQRFVLTSILFTISAPDITVEEGRLLVCRFHDSLTRFATRTPFLSSNYGIGELPQAFCRTCAVRGGTYVLRRSAAAVIRANDSAPAEGIITTEGDAISAQHVFIARNLIASENDIQDAWSVWRFIGVLNSSITRSDLPARFMLSVPKEAVSNLGATVRIRQLDHSTFTCPSGLFVLYAETIERGGSEEDLLKCVRNFVTIPSGNNGTGSRVAIRDTNGARNLLAEEKPTLLWGLTYARDQVDDCNDKTFGVEIIRPPEIEHDADGVIAEAERCFRIAFPDGTFFPDLHEYSPET